MDSSKDTNERNNENNNNNNISTDNSGLEGRANKILKENGENKSDSNKDQIILKRSTFNKLVVLGMLSLLVSAFLGGFTFKTFVTPTFVTVPSQVTSGQEANSPREQNPLMAPPSVYNGPMQPQQIPQPIQKNPVPSVDDDPARGNKDASLLLIEFSDYQCPFCKRFFDESMSKIKQDYIDTGKIRHVFRDYPLPIHKNAFEAALAAQCANDQQKYWQYHDILFKNQTEWENQSANNTIVTFKGYAYALGMNSNLFNQCLDSKKYQEEVNKDLMHGSVYGISGTPTFYIGNEAKGFTQLVGAQPFSSFDNLFKYYESES